MFSTPLKCAVGIACGVLCSSVIAADTYDGVQASLLLRNYFLSRDFRSPGEQSRAAEWGQGFIFKSSAGYTYGIFGLGMEAYAGVGIRLDSSKDHAGTGLFPSYYGATPPDDFSKGGVAIKALVSKTEIKVGQLMPRVPLIASGDSRLLPQIFSGVMLTSNEIDRFTLSAGEMRQANYRNSSNYQNIITGNYQYATSDRFRYQGAQYQLTPDTSLGVWNGTLEDVYGQRMVNLIHSQQSGPWKLGANLAFFDSSEDGEKRAGVIDSRMTSMLLSARYLAHSVSIGYQHNAGGSAFPFIDETDLALANGIQILDFTRANERSWQARYDIDFAPMGFPGLTSFARYVAGEGFPMAGREGKEWERDLDLTYTFQSGPLKNLGIRLRNATVRSDARRDIDEYRIIVSYPISLL